MGQRSCRWTILSCFVIASCLASMPAQAQKAGASMKIQHGTVVGSRSVTIDNSGSSAAAGAIVGGTIGLIAGGSSGKKRRRRAATGAIVGGAAGAASGQPQQAMEYTIDVGGNTKIKVLTDQTQIRQGDCVVVEESGGKANVRRVSPTLCEPESAAIVEELAGEMREEAEECVAAKNELVEATSDEAVDRAIRKISILCDD